MKYLQGRKMLGFILYSAGIYLSTQNYFYTRKYCRYTRNLTKAEVILNVNVKNLGDGLSKPNLIVLGIFSLYHVLLTIVAGFMRYTAASHQEAKVITEGEEPKSQLD